MVNRETTEPQDMHVRIRRSPIAVSTASVVIFLLIWQVVSTFWISPFLLPSPLRVAHGAWQLIRSGQLEYDTAISLARILTGWVFGALVGVPVGLLVGSFRIVKYMVDPFVHFFRFIPALALTTLFMTWLGVGEASKIALIVYATGFLVTVGTATGVATVPEDKISAARCFGASGLFLFLKVRIPATAAHIYTAMRLALANAFLVIIAVEMIAANSGLGYLTWTARLYFKVSWMFTAIITIGIAGFICDRLWRFVGGTLLRRYVRGAAGY